MSEALAPSSSQGSAQVFTVVRRSRGWDALSQQRLLELGVTEMQSRGEVIVLMGDYSHLEIVHALAVIDRTLAVERVTDRSKLPFVCMQ